MNDTASREWLTPGEGAVGASIFFSDSGHEVTGISDALVSVMKLDGGTIANGSVTATPSFGLCQ